MRPRRPIPWGPYGATKAALELVTRTLASELREQGVSAVLVDPGDMRTRMHQEAFPNDDIRPTAARDHGAILELAVRPGSDAVRGQRFAAQHEDARWLQQA